MPTGKPSGELAKRLAEGAAGVSDGGRENPPDTPQGHPDNPAITRTWAASAAASTATWNGTRHPAEKDAGSLITAGPKLPMSTHTMPSRGGGGIKEPR